MRCHSALGWAMLSSVLLTTGCSEDVSAEAVDWAAQQVRADVDALAAKVGADPKVKQDQLTDCVPGQRDSGKEFIYFVRVKTTTGSAARLQGKIRADYEQAGWVARVGTLAGGDDATFTKDGRRIGATVWRDKGEASVSGTSGCLK